jgi:hypothetical protein
LARRNSSTNFGQRAFASGLINAETLKPAQPITSGLVARQRPAATIAVLLVSSISSAQCGQAHLTSAGSSAGQTMFSHSISKNVPQCGHGVSNTR